MNSSKKEKKKRINSEIRNTFMIHCSVIALIISTGVLDPILKSSYAIPVLMILLFCFALFLNKEQSRIFRKSVKVFTATRLYISEKYQKFVSAVGFLSSLFIFASFLILAFIVWIEQFYAPESAWIAYSKIGFLIGAGIYMAFWTRLIFNMRPTFDERFLRVLGKKP
tara:strand:+ start:1174 stop:1674 length:501 start_codon:yes stop_codon:yes gene_type:complete